MTVKRKKKSAKHRGTRTCGWGLCHRGAGQRGGRGKAGSGKKAKCKMPKRGSWSIQRFGKRGFKSKGQIIIQKPINFCELENKIDSFIAKKFAAVDKDVYVIDLEKAGYNKLLSTGKITKKFKINVPFASKSAVAKVKAAGGEVIIPSKKVEKKGSKQ